MNETNPAVEAFRAWLESSDHTQSDVAEILEVSRAAVSKWINDLSYPSEKHAKDLEKLSGGSVPATIWPRRELPEPKTKGGKALQKAVKRAGSVLALSGETGLHQRALSRWVSEECAPRKACVAEINTALGLKLKRSDFQVDA